MRIAILFLGVEGPRATRIRYSNAELLDEHEIPGFVTESKEERRRARTDEKESFS